MLLKLINGLTSTVIEYYKIQHLEKLKSPATNIFPTITTKDDLNNWPKLRIELHKAIKKIKTDMEYEDRVAHLFYFVELVNFAYCCYEKPTDENLEALKATFNSFLLRSIESFSLTSNYVLDCPLFNINQADLDISYINNIKSNSYAKIQAKNSIQITIKSFYSYCNKSSKSVLGEHFCDNFLNKIVINPENCSPEQINLVLNLVTYSIISISPNSEKSIRKLQASEELELAKKNEVIAKQEAIDAREETKQAKLETATAKKEIADLQERCSDKVKRIAELEQNVEEQAQQLQQKELENSKLKQIKSSPTFTFAASSREKTGSTLT